jgi:hypothetical protein
MLAMYIVVLKNTGCLFPNKKGEKILSRQHHWGFNFSNLGKLTGVDSPICLPAFLKE